MIALFLVMYMTTQIYVPVDPTIQIHLVPSRHTVEAGQPFSIAAVITSERDEALNHGFIIETTTDVIFTEIAGPTLFCQQAPHDIFCTIAVSASQPVTLTIQLTILPGACKDRFPVLGVVDYKHWDLVTITSPLHCQAYQPILLAGY